MVLNTKHNLETPILTPCEPKTKETKSTTSYQGEPELIILDTTEDDIEFVKARCDQKQSPSVNSIRSETINPEISTCNIPDHQLLHKKLRILEDKNKRLQIEIHNWKKHYLKTHMELMDNLEKGQKVDQQLDKLSTPVNIPPSKLINKVRPLN